MTSGIIGLGNMGGRIARRMRDEGLPVLGYDVDPEQAEMAGIELADSVAEVAARSGVVLLSLPDSTAVEQVVLGDDGLLANARALENEPSDEWAWFGPRGGQAAAPRPSLRNASLRRAVASPGRGAIWTGAFCVRGRP